MSLYGLLYGFYVFYIWIFLHDFKQTDARRVLSRLVDKFSSLKAVHWDEIFCEGIKSTFRGRAKSGGPWSVHQGLRYVGRRTAS